MPTTPIDAVLAHIDRTRPAALERYKELLAIPSVSTDPAYAGHVRRAAEWVAADLTQSGLQAKAHATDGHPIVLAHTPPDAAPPGAPRVLFYGHYDVQPPDPLELWTTPPFEPTLRDNKMFARGAVDDKGQIFCFMDALRAWHEVAVKNGGKWPVHLTVLIEGEEECGSKALMPFIKRHADELRADFVLICDTSLWETSDGRGVPSITYGLRGLQYFDVQLHNSSRDLHSGVYGGTLANPATILTQVLGRLFDKKSRVAIPGFYDDVIKPTRAERARWKKLGFDEKKFLGDIGVDTPHGEAGYETLERRWARPSCDINGLYGGYGGAGAKTVIPSFAGAKVSFRLAPNQSAPRIAALFKAWLESQPVHGCKWKITDLHGADPLLAPTDSPWVAAASRAFQRTAGLKPLLTREGATIPVCIEFKRLLNLDCLLIGFGREDDCIHSPNEKFNLESFDLGRRTIAAVLAELSNF